MRIYKTPVLNNNEQKFVGGIVSFRQLAYILGGGVFSYSIASRLYKIEPMLLLLSPVLYGFFLMLAFYTVPRLEINLDTYLVLKLKFFVSQKIFKYKN